MRRAFQWAQRVCLGGCLLTPWTAFAASHELQHSNPVDAGVAYSGNSKNYRQSNDPMVWHKTGGVSVFGGGLALYAKDGMLVGAIGLSGDTSCTDYIIARIF